MLTREWYRTDEVYEILAKKNVEALRHWIRKGKKEGWLKVGKHIKPEYPNSGRVTWLVHLERCQSIGDR